MATPVPSAEPADYADEAEFRSRIMTPGLPVILRGAASHWPLIEGGTEALLNTLHEFDTGREAEVFVGAPEIGQRYYYEPDLAGFNFARENMTFAEGLARIVGNSQSPSRESVYMGSLPSERYFPGIEEHTQLAFMPSTVRPRFWIGSASSVACHYDTLDNLACVAAGRRRFTLYPPEAISDLYVGPIDFTMAGQPVGLAVESEAGDPRYPRFEARRDTELVAELEEGDAIYIPKLWWHKVEALEPLNVLVNFWWDGFAAGPDQPYAAMLLSLIAIAERPEAERAAWRSWFDHYVFRSDGHPLAFLPEAQRGILGPLEDGNYQRIRIAVMRMLRNG